jgi:hypothetical protein
MRCATAGSSSLFPVYVAGALLGQTSPFPPRHIALILRRYLLPIAAIAQNRVARPAIRPRGRTGLKFEGSFRLTSQEWSSRWVLADAARSRHSGKSSRRPRLILAACKMGYISRSALPPVRSRRFSCTASHRVAGNSRCTDWRCHMDTGRRVAMANAPYRSWQDCYGGTWRLEAAFWSGC